jgi:NADP-dependent 3-hydroxy acid dehydrogenase YdfG
MTKTIVVVGFGPGVSTAVAEKFGAEGYAVALVARTPGKLAAGATALADKGIACDVFPADASDPASIRRAIAAARDKLGPIAALHWNAYSGSDLGDLLTADPANVREVFDVGVVGLLAAVQEVLPDLKAAADGAILVTNGAFGELHPQVDLMAVGMKTSGVALANAAKHKLVGLLIAALKDTSVFVGEVMIAGAVKGTAFAAGGDGLDPVRIAGEFWRLKTERTDNYARVS